MEKPLLFLVDDGGGFWKRADMRPHWERWREDFAFVECEGADVDVFKTIQKCLDRAPIRQAAQRACLVTDARMHDVTTAGLELAKFFVSGSKYRRAVIYSTLAAVPQPYSATTSIVSETTVDDPSVLPRLRQFLLTGEIRRIGEVTSFWRAICRPWKSAIDFSLNPSSGLARSHFRPAVGYGRFVGDPVTADYWLDAFAVAWPKGFAAPYSQDSFALFSPMVADEWKQKFGPRGDPGAAAVLQKLRDAFHPDDSLECAARWHLPRGHEGSLRLLWEAVQCGGTPDRMLVETTAEEDDLSPESQTWIERKRKAVKQRLETLGSLEAVHSAGRQRLLEGARRELADIHKYFDILQRDSNDHEV